MDAEPALRDADSPESFGPGDAAVARRWATEIQMSHKRNRMYNEKCRKIWDKYHGKRGMKERNSYNALYANTEILAPSVYNTLPTPDIRRRFGDADPISKAVSTVLEHSLSYTMEGPCSTFDEEIELDVMDMLVVGRGVSRVKYIPVIESDKKHKEANEADDDEAVEEYLSSENVEIEHVMWDKILFGPGRRFKHVPWVAFIHQMTRDELIEHFGREIAENVALTNSPEDGDDSMRNPDKDEDLTLFKTATIYEIWDKDKRERVWTSPSFPNGTLKTEDDPLGLEGFYPIPNPLLAIRDSDTFIPMTLFENYKSQADELERVSTRINNLIDACKVRGIYDPALGTDITELFRGEDNDLIPCSRDARVLAESGGIANAIWFAPIDVIAKVVEILYAQREECKKVIFELTGLADIMRGATDANETYGAQALKTQFGMTRLSKMQRSVQKYIRDICRLVVEVMCKKFSIETFKRMSKVELPTDMEIMPQRMALLHQLMMAHMQQAQQAQQPMHPMQQLPMPPGPPPGMGAPQGPPMGQHPPMPMPGPPPGMGAPPMQPGPMGHSLPSPAPAQPMPPPPQPPMPPPGQPQAQGMPGQAPQLPPKPVTWEDVHKELGDEMMISFSVDIETDSTIAAMQQEDLSDLKDCITAMVQLITELGPIVQMGALPFPAFKELLLMAARKFRMGSAIEDIFDQIQQPPPPAPPPNPKLQEIQQQGQLDLMQAKQDAQIKIQIAQADAQAKGHTEQMRMQADMQIETMKAKMEAQLRQVDAQSDERQARLEAILKAQSDQHAAQIQLFIARLNNQAKIDVAEIAAQSDLQQSQIAAAQAAMSAQMSQQAANSNND
jgi:hypothetical protein